MIACGDQRLERSQPEAVERGGCYRLGGRFERKKAAIILSVFPSLASNKADAFQRPPALFKPLTVVGLTKKLFGLT